MASDVPAEAGVPAPAPFSLPCVHLGRVLKRLPCNCPRRSTYACPLHGFCTPATAYPACSDYAAAANDA